MTTSETIRARIKAAGASYFANHNISAYIEPAELDQLVDEVAGQFQGVLGAAWGQAGRLAGVLQAAIELALRHRAVDLQVA